MVTMKETSSGLVEVNHAHCVDAGNMRAAQDLFAQFLRDLHEGADAKGLLLRGMADEFAKAYKQGLHSHQPQNNKQVKGIK